MNIVDSGWLNRVDNIIGFQAFLATAQKQWQALDRDGTGRVSFDSFIKHIQHSLAGLWDERLRPAVEALHTKAKDIFSHQVSQDSRIRQFQELWQSRIVETWQKRVVSPATTVFSFALNHFLEAKKSNLASPKAFIDSMRVQLGLLWDANLEQPLREFYAGAKRATQEDLIALRQHLEPLIPPTLFPSVPTASKLSGRDTSIQARVIQAIASVFWGILNAFYGVFDVAVKIVSRVVVLWKKLWDFVGSLIVLVLTILCELIKPFNPFQGNGDEQRSKPSEVHTIWSWGIAQVQRFVPGPIQVFVQHVYDGALEVLTPHYENLKSKLATFKSHLLITERITEAYNRISSLVLKAIKFVTTTSLTDIFFESVAFLLDFPLFLGQVVGFYPIGTSSLIHLPPRFASCSRR